MRRRDSISGQFATRRIEMLKPAAYRALHGWEYHAKKMIGAKIIGAQKLVGNP
jgi:hypothetical protein